MPPIRLLTFSGKAPKVDPTALGDTAALVATNCRLESAKLEPFKQPLPVAGVTIPAGTKTIFPYNSRWLTWPVNVDVARGQLVDDQYSRIYYTGDGLPKVRGLLSGVESEFSLGLPVPASKIVAVASQKSTTTWTRTWKSYYEEPDGTKKDEADIAATEVTVGKRYTFTKPAKVTASASAKCIVWFEARNAAGGIMGRVYPQSSLLSYETDLRIDGAPVTARQSGTSTITIDLSYDMTAAGEYTVERSWVYTYVTAFGEEGPPSEPSEIIAMDPTKNADLTGMLTAAPAGYPNVVKKRIYRTVTGDAGTSYKYVGELDVGVDGFQDTLMDVDTAETLPSDTWDAPPADMAGLVAMAGEFFAGFSGKTIYFSEPGYPHAWPQGYAVSVDYDVVALQATGTTLIVLTTGCPYLVSAVDPASASLVKLTARQACVSVNAIEFGGAIIYASQDGLVGVTGMTALVYSEPYLSKEQWAALHPDTMRLYLYDDDIYVFSDNAAMVFTIGAGSLALVDLSVTVPCAFSDIEDDAFYIVQGTELQQWNAGALPMTATWRTKRFFFPKPAWFSVLRLVAESYPQTVRFYADGTLVLIVQVVDDVARRMPRLRSEKTWEVEVETTARITELMVGQSMGDV